MVKNSIKYLALLLFVFVSCTKEEPCESTVGNKVDMTVKAEEGSLTRTSFNGSNAALWEEYDLIGVLASCGSTYTDDSFQRFYGNNSSASATASFSGTLTDVGAGVYTLYALYPFRETIAGNTVSSELPWIQHPGSNTWDPKCDFMLGSSSSTSGSVSGVANAETDISFNHKMGWLALSFSGFSDCAAENVRYVRISTGYGGNPIAGSFSVDITHPGNPITPSSDASERSNFVIADFSDKNVTLSSLTAYFTLFPVTDATIEIAVKTTGHYIECTRTGLTITAGQIVSAEVTRSSTNGTTADPATSTASICGTLPSMSSKTSGTLNALLLGHSFGLDCTEHLPGLLSDAGITNLNLCRFHNNDCQLNEYWSFITTKGAPQEYYSRNGSGWNKSATTPRVIDKLMDTAWDVIVLQQSTCDGRSQRSPNWGGAADYSTYQPYLSLIMEYIVCTQRTRQNKNPYIVWNMIRSSQSDWRAKYSLIVSATRSMKAETGIDLILTPGTAMMTARTDDTKYGFDFTDDKVYHILCRDIGSGGWHASQGLGRYLEACTWFEQLVVPIYKAADPNLTVVGNGYLPTDYCKEWSDDSDKVTAQKAAALQAIAHATKVADPANNESGKDYPGNPFYSTNPQ